MNNFSTQRSYENRLGIQASQLISRDAKLNDSVRLENISENLNRFLSAHSRKNFTQKNSSKFRLSEYFNKGLKAKSYSTHHYLCGPLNTNRVTRKTISGNFDSEFTTRPLSVADLYNNAKQTTNTKPPWIEQRKPTNIHDSQENPSEATADSSFNFNPRLDENFSNDKVPVCNEPVLENLKDSCPLYDSNKYEEQYANPVYEKNTNTSDDENTEPGVSRYNFFIGSTEKLPEFNANDVKDCRNDIKCIKTVCRKRRPREEVFQPLLTSSQD